MTYPDWLNNFPAFNSDPHESQEPDEVDREDEEEEAEEIVEEASREILYHAPRWGKAGSLFPSGIVVHSMGEFIRAPNGTVLPAHEWLDKQYDILGPGSAYKSSAHAFIQPNGTIMYAGASTDIRYHAGVSQWHEFTNLNRHFLGVEVLVEGIHTYDTFIHAINTPPSPYTDVQYEALVEVVEGWLGEHPTIVRANIITHAQAAPGRKFDPGPQFDWERFMGELGVA